MPTVLMVVAPKDFRDEELLETRAVLEGHGYEVKIASERTKIAAGMLGARVDIDTDIHDVDAADFIALVFVGGAGAEGYFKSAKALNLARQANKQGKVVGAICIAPSILANAGVLRGKRATSWPSERSNLEKKGATWLDEAVVTDGNIVTACGPKAARAFGEAIVSALEATKLEPEARERHLEGEGRHRRKRHGLY
jgi:protease I